MYDTGQGLVEVYMPLLAEIPLSLSAFFFFLEWSKFLGACITSLPLRKGIWSESHLCPIMTSAKGTYAKQLWVLAIFLVLSFPKEP